MIASLSSLNWHLHTHATTQQSNITAHTHLLAIPWPTTPMANNPIYPRALILGIDFEEQYEVGHKIMFWMTVIIFLLQVAMILLLIFQMDLSQYLAILMSQIMHVWCISTRACRDKHVNDFPPNLASNSISDPTQNIDELANLQSKSIVYHCIRNNRAICCSFDIEPRCEFVGPFRFLHNSSIEEEGW